MYKKIMRFLVIVAILTSIVNCLIGLINAIGLIDYPITDPAVSLTISIMPIIIWVTISAILIAIYKKYLKKSRHYEIKNEAFFHLYRALRKK